MAPSDRQRELLIVFNLVRAKDDRSILVLSCAAAQAELRSRRDRCSEQHPHEHTDDRERCLGSVPASRHQPSSKWSSIEVPKIKLTPVGVHAASVTGTLAESPKANTMSETK